MKKTFLVIALAAALNGCGGGGSSGGVSQSSVIAGKVIDGYIEGARVCLDIDRDLRCNADPAVKEPETTTDKNGAYTLTYSGNVDGFVVIAVIDENAKDIDDGGKTIGQAGKSPFNLAAPVVKSGVSTGGAGTDAVVVTPLTTLVTHEALSDPATQISSTSIAEAQTSVKTKLGLKTNVIGVDYVNASNTDMHNIAKVVSVALGETAKEISKQLVEQAKTDTALAASKTSSDAQKLVQNSVVKTVLDSVMPALINKETGNLTAAKVDDAVDAARKTVTTSVSGVINNIIAGTKSGPGEVANLRALMQVGIIFGEVDSGFRPRDKSKNLEIGDWVWADNLNIEYNKGDIDTKAGESLERSICKYSAGSSGSNTAYRAAYCNGRWFEPIDGSIDYALSTSGEWKPIPDFDPKNLKINANCFSESAQADMAALEACLVTKPIAGKKISDLIPEVCTPFGEHTPPVSCKSAVFKAGSIGFDFTVSTNIDNYSFWLNRDPAQRTWHDGSIWTGTVQRDATNLGDFVRFATEASKARADYRIGLSKGFAVRFSSFTEQGGKVVSAEVQWVFQDPDTSNAPVEVLKSTSKVTVVTPFDKKQEVLVIAPPPEWHAKYPGDMVGRDVIFVAHEGKIRRGEVEYAKVKRQIVFGTGGIHGNREMLDSVLEAVGLPAFPYNEAKSLTAN